VPFDENLDSLFAFSPNSKTFRDSFIPHCEVSEDEKNYVIELDIPGMKKEDIQVEAHDGYLKVSGERKSIREEKEKNYHVSERSYGNFSRIFRLGDKADLVHVEGQYENGVLKLKVPKTEKTQARQIKID
jgi:HSP20 family protein